MAKKVAQRTTFKTKYSGGTLDRSGIACQAGLRSISQPVIKPFFTFFYHTMVVLIIMAVANIIPQIGSIIATDKCVSV